MSQGQFDWLGGLMSGPAAKPSMKHVGKDLRSLVKRAVAAGWTLEFYGPGRSATGVNAVSPSGVRVPLPHRSGGTLDRLNRQARSQLRQNGIS